MANILMNLNKNKPKSCQGRNGSRSVYGRKAYDVADVDFTDDSRKEYEKRKPKHGIRVNGKWVTQPEREKQKQVNAPAISMGQFKDSCRSEGRDG